MSPLDSSLEIDTVARTIYGEARSEPFDGQLAVGWVIRNRVTHPGWWGSDWITVCRKPYQFSCWLETDPNLPKLRAASLQSSAFRTCYAAALLAYDGALPDPTFGSDHYYAPLAMPAPAWAMQYEETARIGGHRFFSSRRPLKTLQA